MSEFQLQFDGEDFESSARDNGFHYWRSSVLMKHLGYDQHKLFTKAIQDAMRACLALGIHTEDHFERITNEDGQYEYKLSRFACFMVAMNGDPRRPEVAGAQAYFAMIAEAVRAVSDPEHVERVVLRKEVTDQEKTLSDAAFKAGVESYPQFQNAGYMGMYNMPIWELRQKRGIDSGRSPLDFMGKTELAANLFRITQTEEKIKAGGIVGQAALERTAKSAGERVREAMIEIGGTPPEEMLPAPDIQSSKKGIKQAHKALDKIDKKPKKK